MICSECNNNKAAVFYKQNINGKVTELALCSECAQKRGFWNTDSLFSDFFSVPKLVKNKPLSQKKCSLCGSTEADFVKDGKVSCPECYNTFADELSGALKRIHGNVSHIGRAPSKYKKENDKKKQLEDLKLKLSEAIQKEEYENAAVFRDEIKKLENEGV